MPFSVLTGAGWCAVPTACNKWSPTPCLHELFIAEAAAPAPAAKKHWGPVERKKSGGGGWSRAVEGGGGRRRAERRLWWWWWWWSRDPANKAQLNPIERVKKTNGPTTLYPIIDHFLFKKWSLRFILFLFFLVVFYCFCITIITSIDFNFERVNLIVGIIHDLSYSNWLQLKGEVQKNPTSRPNSTGACFSNVD